MTLNELFKNVVEEKNQELEKEFGVICGFIYNLFKVFKEVSCLYFGRITADGIPLTDRKEHVWGNISNKEIPIICSKYSCTEDFFKDFKKYTSSNPYLLVEREIGPFYRVAIVNENELSKRTKFLKKKRKEQLLNEFNKICEWMIEQFDKEIYDKTLRLLFWVDDKGICIKDVYLRWSYLYWSKLPTIRDTYDFQNALSEFIRDFGEYAYFNANLYIDIYGETCIEVSLGDAFDILNNE